MSFSLRNLLLVVLMMLMTGCVASDPVWRTKAQNDLQQLEREDALKLRPESYRSILEAFEHGEAILKVRDDDLEADLYYQLACQKSELLKQELSRYRAQMAEEARQKAEEERLRQEEERRRLAAEAEEQRQRQEAELAAKTKSSSGADSVGQPVRDRLSLPSSYTVRRGETLPQIASRPEIYNETALWPLIYRANRDQVRDPYQLWPGQILKIPRSYSRDEALEARKQNHRRSL